MLVCAIPARAAHSVHRCARLKPRQELRCARVQLRHARMELSAPMDSPPHSRAYWRWSARVARREIRAAKWRIAHPPIAHLRLWLCIHSFEGAWPDDTGNSYFGGLQMTANWGPYGRPLVYHANTLSAWGQMSVAEHGYRIVIARQGYSFARYSWLPSQWYHPSCFGFA